MSLTLDITAFEALFQVNYAGLCNTSYRIVQDKDVAEDVVQDIFVKLWEKRDVLQISGSLKAYLFQSVVNQSLNHLRKSKNLERRENHFGTETGSDVNTTDQSYAVKETRQRLETALKALPEGCRTVFILSRYEHQSYRAIADHLGISVKTVENQMVKALRHLRNWLLLLLVSTFF